MDCPKCGGAMKPDSYEGVEYDQCAECGGLWFDALEAEELLDAKNPGQIDTGDPGVGKQMNKSRECKCPRCDIWMVPVRDREQPHIQLESCRQCHGLFFDAGEFKDFCDETFWGRVKDKFARK